jgi:hypothetical protein
MITNRESGTSIDEIANGIYRISTPVPPQALPGGFTFNQYLIVDDSPLLYHTGPKKMFPLVRESIASIIPVGSLRYIGFSHFEADECGSLNEFLEVAPDAEPLCSQIAKLVSVDDVAVRPARALADGEELSLGEEPRGGACCSDTPTSRRRCGIVHYLENHAIAAVRQGEGGKSGLLPVDGRWTKSAVGTSRFRNWFTKWLEGKCRKEDSNLHGVAPTRT